MGRKPVAKIVVRLKQGAAMGVLLAVLPQAALAGNIATAGTNYQVSKLGTSVSPVFQAGTLQIDTAGQTYSQNFTLDTSTTNTIDQTSNSATFSGIFSDAVSASAGNLVIANSGSGGAVTLTGISTYTGTTTINAGATLLLSGAGSVATSAGIYDAGTFDISQTPSGATVTSLNGAGSVVLGSQSLSLSVAAGSFTGVISGSGGLILTSGSESLGGENTYTGGTTITAGTLTVGTGTTGSIIGNVVDSGTLAFDRDDSVSFGGVVSGVGGLSQTGAGILTLTAVQTYSGTTAITAGTLALGPSASIAASSGVNATGTLDISATSGTSITSLAGTGAVALGNQTLTITGASGIFSGVISGSGGVTLIGGTETLSGLNTYTGATNVNGGTLRLGGATIANNISDAATVSFFSSTTIAMTGVISGTGSVSQTGAGVTTISTVQAYTGSTTISGGTLALAGAGNISASSNVVDNAIFDISGATSAAATLPTLSGNGTVQLGAQTLTLADASGTFSGAIAGTGGFVLAGGTQTLSGVNTYTGITTISAGTLHLGNSSSLSASAKVVDNAVLDISGATSAGSSQGASIQSLSGSGSVTLGSDTLVLTSAADTFSGTISGAGGLTISGGTQTLSGVNTYTGTTTITNGGVLAIAAGGSLAATSAMADSGTFDISGAGGAVSLASLSGLGSVTLGANNLVLNNASGIFSGTISGIGKLTISGGTEILYGANNYTGGTLISGGTLQLGNGFTIGSIIGDVVDNGTLAFDRSDAVTFGGAISGSGGINQLSTGSVALTAANTYTGGTVISGGTLQLGNGGTSGSITGDVTDNGTLAFDRADAVTFNGTISGSGGVSQIGTGTLTLTTIEAYTGNTVIAGGGTMILTSSASIASSADVIDNGVLDISAVTAPRLSSLGGAGAVLLGAQSLTLTAGADTFSGILSGSGGLTVSGGNQILSNTNTYTGATSVSGGTLTVNGSIAGSSNVSVASGGTLAGNGTTSAVTIAGGGTLAPGSAGSGTLKVNGNVSFASGSELLVNMSSASSPSLNASGSAALAGTLAVASTDGTYTLGQKVTVLTANDGISGSFTAAPITTSTGAQFKDTVSYDANDVYLEIDLAKLSPLLPATATANQAHVVGGIDAAIAAGDTVPTAIQNLGTVSSATLAADAGQLAGEIGADVPRAGNALLHPFMNAIFDRLDDSGSHRGVWASGFVGSDLVNGDAASGAQKFQSHGAGFAGGLDWRASPNLTLGVAVSAGSSDFHVADGLANGKIDAYQAAIYGLTRFTQKLYGSFAGLIAVDDATTNRTLNVSGTDLLTGKVSPLTVGGRYEAGLKLGFITPYLAAEDVLVHTPSYAETATSGASSFALRYGMQNANNADVELGLRQGVQLPLSRTWTLNVSDRVAWSHALATAWSTNASFASLPDSGFTTYGAKAGRDSALISLGAGLRNRNGLGLDAHFESSIAHNAQSYTGIAGLNYTW